MRNGSEHVEKGTNESGGNENYVQKQKDGTINIQGPNDALHIHEIRHVADHLTDGYGLNFDKDGISGSLARLGPYYNEKIEQSGNRAQYGVDPNSVYKFKGTINQINLRYLANLKDDRGRDIYPDLKEKWDGLSNMEKKKYE